MQGIFNYSTKYTFMSAFTFGIKAYYVFKTDGTEPTTIYLLKCRTGCSAIFTTVCVNQDI